MLQATARGVLRLTRPIAGFYHGLNHVVIDRSVVSATRPSRLLWMRQEAEMRMLEEEQRRKLEEERQQGGTEVSKEDTPERAQLDEDSSTTVLLGPPVTEDGEGKNEEDGQEICQADGDDCTPSKKDRFQHDDKDDT